jgi:hypothetical protein
MSTNEFIPISSVDNIKELKAIEHKEKEILLNTIAKNPGANSADEILVCVGLSNLIYLSSELYNNDEYTVGYKLGINAAETLSQLYQSIAPIKLFAIKESARLQKTKKVKIEGKSDEVANITLIVHDIMQEISTLLLCEDFIHAIKTSFNNDQSGIFTKVVHLKQYSKTIPNPNTIPLTYKTLLDNNKQEIYKAYTNFVYYFAGNWHIIIKKLGKIKKSLNDLHQLCPFIRLSIINEINSSMEVDDIHLLPEDIKRALLSVDEETMLYSHNEFIINTIHNGTKDKVTIETISNRLRKIAEILKNPLKDIIHLNIVINSTIQCMLLMKELQSQNSLPPSQETVLSKVEAFFEKTMKQHSLSVGTMVSISRQISQNYALDKPIIQPSGIGM